MHIPQDDELFLLMTLAQLPPDRRRHVIQYAQERWGEEIAAAAPEAQPAERRARFHATTRARLPERTEGSVDVTSCAELAKAAGLSREAISRYVRQGLIKAEISGNAYVIPKAEAERWLATRPKAAQAARRARARKGIGGAPPAGTYRAKELAKMSGLTIGGILYNIREGNLKAEHRGREVFVSHEDAHAWLAARGQQTSPQLPLNVLPNGVAP